ncbi:NADPH-dependent 7-cyano-7-deazaguanine reductase QueF [Saccharicrinis aurantiacus]|uniref:NADPH-dependent 7-cyano-7-deazaguanine reductase QueF n=1 Tax=Saccharicrinis aurantiacus TaxID=1849719 RepID=UPI0008395A8F|nr:NADPH-dependent 7-cyano-7-deazaguanine reductase QueF [Saccharicrinis aurantiacus]
MSTQEQIEGKVLGKQINHPKQYAPEILVAVPRHLNRESYNIKDDNLPFIGYDAWHAYELSFLTENGLPVTGILKLVYPCDSEALVESKSLKLYLNSFNMGKYGNNAKNGIKLVLETVTKDLSDLLNTIIKVSFHQNYNTEYDFDDYKLLEGQLEADNILFTDYTETPSLLGGEVSESEHTYKIASNLLRSNCKITHQPDWGSVFIHIKSKYTIDLDGVLQYIVSIRDENHFHEEICEMIYKRLLDKFEPNNLMVACLYTRRGGIDICPVRSNSVNLLPKNIIQSQTLTKPAFRQ